jgi:uncharacterized protein (UPF0305 family)
MYKTMIWHDSKLTIKRYKSFYVKDFSQAVLNSIYDKNHYMEEDIKNVYSHDNAMLKLDPLLRHINWAHVYNTVSYQSRLFHELQGLLGGTSHRKAITRCVQVGSGVEGLDNY